MKQQKTSKQSSYVDVTFVKDTLHVLCPHTHSGASDHVNIWHHVDSDGDIGSVCDNGLRDVFDIDKDTEQIVFRFLRNKPRHRDYIKAKIISVKYKNDGDNYDEIEYDHYNFDLYSMIESKDLYTLLALPKKWAEADNNVLYYENHATIYIECYEIIDTF